MFWTDIRKVRLLTVCALVLMYACVLASARQSTTGDAAAKKPAPANTTAHKPQKSSAKSTRAHTASMAKRSRKKRVRGQQKIDSDRAQAIQEALIREHYLNGEPTGTWNQASEEAMRRYQADNGWQNKTVPDSRALIKLGLGPSKDHLLNPESAMTTVPDAPRAASLPTSSQNPSPTTSHSAPPTATPAPATSSQSNSPNPQ